MRVIATLIIIVSFIYSCTKDVGALPAGPVFNDSTLFVLASSPSGKFTWKNSTNDSVFTSAAAHSSVPYKLLMNKKAKDVCTDNGKLPVNAIFPDSSMLVKQIYNAGQTQINQYVVMYKLNGNWKWAKYSPGGSTIFSINQDASVCIGCHTSTRDRAWTFDSHP